VIPMSKQAKGKPWHSKESTAYHDNSQCSEAKKVPPSKRLDGTGQKPMCQECGKLNQLP
jgi:hypothetical protein